MRLISQNYNATEVHCLEYKYININSQFAESNNIDISNNNNNPDKEQTLLIN